MSRVGAALRAAREASAVPVDALADVLGIHPAEIFLIEGQDHIDEETYRRVIGALVDMLHRPQDAR